MVKVQNMVDRSISQDLLSHNLALLFRNTRFRRAASHSYLYQTLFRDLPVSRVLASYLTIQVPARTLTPNVRFSQTNIFSAPQSFHLLVVIFSFAS